MAPPSSAADRVLIAAALVLVALCLGLWAGTRWWRAPSLSVAVPIAPGREVVLQSWTPEPYYLPSDFDHSMLQPADGPLTLALWYHHVGASRITQLATFGVPTWPLIAIAAGAALVVLWRLTRAKAPPAPAGRRW
jgi:hypothetical protein